jgi:spore coat polysaccharide biosynthesis protein SpsF
MKNTDIPQNGTVCTIEARMGSSRLPGKSLKPLVSRPMLEWVIERTKMAQSIDRIVVATSVHPRDDVIEEFAENSGVYCFRGSESDVLNRLAGAINQHQPDLLVCLTGDNPFIDPQLIDAMIDFVKKKQLDFTSTVHMFHSKLWKEERTFPAGVAVQVLQPHILLEMDRELKDPTLREHTTMGIYHRTDDRYKIKGFHAEGPFSNWQHPKLRLTVDTPEDFELARILIESMEGKLDFSTGEVIQKLANNPQWQGINNPNQ